MLIKKNKGPAVFQPMIGKVIGTQWIEVADGLAKKLLAANSGYSGKPTVEEPIVETVIVGETVEEEVEELEEIVDEEDVSEDESFDDEDEFEEDEDFA